MLNDKSSPSTSEAEADPIAVWFSAALKVAEDEITGATSLTLVILTVISWVTEFTPSLTVTVAV